ncbi:MAG: HEPN domain-containing protein [Candidatus Eremiobacteraeota bacterium]|nr:HEPN domain-containing protein [Candidatus Eremiobacteraeota bacterium]
MSDPLLNLALHRLEKAREDIDSSDALLKISKFAQSINRSYYAMFHATRAILALDRFDAKKHSAVISFLIFNYVKAGKISEGFSKMLTTAEKIRINSDYDDFYIADKETAEEQLSNARSFIEMAEAIIDEKRKRLNG